MSSPPPTQLEFQLRIHEGRGRLGLREEARLGPVGLSALELDVPDLRFPFDVSGGADRFQTRRCDLTAAELRVDAAQLRAWVERRSALERFGLSRMQVRLCPDDEGGALELSGRARVGERETALTARLRLTPAAAHPQAIDVLLTEVRTFGFLPAPAPLVGVGLLLGLGATPTDDGMARPGPAALTASGRAAMLLVGVDRVSLNPLELILWEALPRAGWRLPRTREVRLTGVRVERDAVRLQYGTAETLSLDAARAALQRHERTREADRLLARGDLPAALQAYERLPGGSLEEGEPDAALLERRLAVLQSMPARFEEAVRLATELRARWPERPFAELALAAVDAERGDARGAAERYVLLHGRFAAAGAEADARACAARAGEEYARADDRAATPWLERVHQDVPGAAALLATRYEAEERWRDLLALERRRLLHAPGAEAEAAAHARIGRLLLERLDDPLRARDELDRALRLDDRDGDTWALLSRALEATGDSARAVEALERAAARSSDGARGLEALLGAAELAERAGQLEQAREKLEQALDRAPADARALGRLAALLSRMGRAHEAIAAYERAVDAGATGGDDGVRAAALCELARLERDRANRPAARTHVERSLALKATPAALRLAAELAEADGRIEDLVPLYERLAHTGDREAPLKQARALFSLGRFSEAAAAAEAISANRPEALQLLVDARAALGQRELEIEALEKLVPCSPQPEPRIRLARHRADDGELDGARELLQDALAAVPHDAGAARVALELLCDVLLRQGDDGALEAALGRLAQARPESDRVGRARALAAQGAARARLGLSAEAAESYRAALALDPDDAHTRAGLAEAAWALKRWDEARAALEPLHDKGLPPRVERALRLGEIAERQQQPAAAIGFYQAAIEAGASGSDAVRAWSALANVHHARADYDAEARVLLAAADDERTNEGAQQRASRLVQAADLLRKHGGRTVEAVEIYERALALDPHQLAALDALEGVAEADGDRALQAQVLGRKLAATARRPSLMKAILGRLAALQESLGRPDAARAAWMRALEIDPEYRPALSYLAREARQAGDTAEEIARLEQLVALPADPADPDGRVADLSRLAQLHAAAGRLERAEPYARRVVELQPREPRALQLLDELYTQSGRTSELVPVLAERAQVERNPDIVFDLLLRRASLLDAGGHRAEALAAYEELTTLEPKHATPWTRLAALLRKEEAWPRLAVVLERLAEREADLGRRAEAESLWVEAAHLHHDRLKEPARAQAALERTLLINPGSRAALGGLLQLARARGDHAEEDRLLGRMVEIEGDPAARGHAVGDRARARQARGDVEGALALVRELDPARAPESVLKLRVELEEARGQLAEATPALEALRARAHEQGDAASERWAVRRLAHLAAVHGPSPATEDVLRRAVELDADDRESAAALAQLERARGDDRAYLASLERILRTARRTFEGASREAELCVEMATVLERLGDLPRAEGRLRDALEAMPDDGQAWRRLGLVLRKRTAHAEAAQALERAAALSALDAEGFCALAECLGEAGEHARAAAAWSRAGDAAPPRARAEALERAGQEEAAIKAWRAVGDTEGVQRAAQLARKRAERLFQSGRQSEARVAALDALAGAPDDEDALGWALHGLSSPAILALLDELSQRLQPADAAALYRRVAKRLVDRDARTALARANTLAPDAKTLVALAERESGGVEAARHYMQALELDPGCADAALGLARVGKPSDAARALAATYEQVADARTRVHLSASLGLLLRDRMADPRGARDAFRAAVAESSRGDGELRRMCLRALATLERAAGDARAAEEALEMLHQEDGAVDADLRHLAELYAERGAHKEAVALLRGLPPSELYFNCLEQAGEHAVLLSLLEAEAPRRMPEDARALYGRAAQLAAGPLADPARAVELLEKAIPLGPSDAELWVRLGQLYGGPLDNPDRAARCFARAYAADHSRTDVLLPLADFHHALGEHEPAGDYYRTALEHNAVPPEAMQRVHLRLAEHARQRADAIAEEEELRRAVTFGAGAEAWPRLAAIYRVRGDRARLAHALKALVERASGPERAALLRELVALVPPEEAATLDEQILADDAADDAARERMLERVRKSGDAALLVARLERELPRAPLERQGAYALELGRVALKLGDETRAIEAFRAALKAAPSVEAARALMELYARHKREHEAAQALEGALFDPRFQGASPSDVAEVARLAARAYLQPGGSQAGSRALAFFDRARSAGIQVQMDPAAYRALLRAELRFPELVQVLDQAARDARDGEQRLVFEIEAAEALDRELGQRDEAARRYAGLLDRFPTRRDLAERARQLYAAAGEPIHALAALDKEMRLAPPEDLAQLKIVRGELLLAAGADAEAEAEFLHALITTPRVGRAHAALADVYKRRGDLAGALEHLIAAADAPDLEPARAARCAVDAADVLLKEGDVPTAERLYQLAAALDPAERDAVEGLARLAAARGEHERHADLLGRAVLLTADHRERARLLLQRARLFQLELDRELDAYRCLKEAVACDPHNRDAARALKELAEARGEHALAAEQLYREIAATPDAEARARLHLELARLLEDKLLEPDDALRNFEQATEILEAAGEAQRRSAPWAELVRLYTNAQRLRDAAATLDRWAEALSQPGEAAVRAETLVRAGELYERAGDSLAAQARLARAAAIGGEAGKKADDWLLRLADSAGDPEELKRRIEERLAVEPEGQDRLRLLRRLLEVAVHLGDANEVDLRAQEVLARAPDDPIAFVERKRLLESRGDDAAVAQLLRARAEALQGPGELGERAERRFEAGRLAERLGELQQAAADYEAALEADPDHVPALDALADLSWRTNKPARARVLYAQLGERPSTLPRDEVLCRRAELAEQIGQADEARQLYQAASAHNPSCLQAHEALTRLELQRGDDRAAFQQLRTMLDLLPLDAVDRITDLRRQLGRLALRLGEREQARTYFELVLAQDPDRADVLQDLVALYGEQQLWEEAAAAYGRLSYLADRPDERADLLFRKGEILRLALGDIERANDVYLKAADLHPGHAPTLRRLIAHYYREADFQQLRDVVQELENLGAPLEEAAVEAGLGIALSGDEARGTVVVAVSQPPPERVAAALAEATAKWVPRELGQLDPALRASVRALGGGEGGRTALLDALRARVIAQPADLGARRALGRIYDLAGDVHHARMQYAVNTFVDPLGPAGTRLRELPPPPTLAVDESWLMHPRARGALRDALCAIGPLVRGLPRANIEADPAPAWADKLRPIAQALGVDDIEVAVVVDLADPAWAEPTRPVRLLVARRALADEAVARFAAARALAALQAGVSLVEGRPVEDVVSLVRAAAVIFLPDSQAARAGGRFVHAWEAELRQLMPPPEMLPENVRARAEMQLASALVDSAAFAAAPIYGDAERMSADRVAYALTGDLRAALSALAPPDATTVAARLACLTEVPAIVELLAFAAHLA